jgi:CheY-like chemotaxis protein
MVLVVDDQPEIRETLAEILEDEGYHVATAANGREALSCLHTDGDCSLILMDLMMPVMDGWELAAELERDPATAGIPRVVVSGAGDVPRAAAALKATEFLQKPLDLDRLLSVVHRHC